MSPLPDLRHRDPIIQRLIDWLRRRTALQVEFAAGRVIGGGGSSYSLLENLAIASVAGQATGVCRVVLAGRATAVGAIWPIAVATDNAGWAHGILAVSASPVTFDVYIANPVTGALTNRSFFVICAYRPASG